jgi:hypothetical protein
MKKKLSQLERDTAAYFENMTEQEAWEERELEAALCNTPQPQRRRARRVAGLDSVWVRP